MSALGSPRRSAPASRPFTLALALTVGLIAALTGTAPALASTPFWQAISEPAPSYLPPGGEGEIIVGVSDLGDAPVSGASTPVSITDRLPAGLSATAITGSVRNGVEVKCPAGSPPPSLTCTFAGVLYPYERLTITVKVKVSSGLAGVPANEVAMEGGQGPEGAPVPAYSSSDKLTVSSEPTPFGLQSYQLSPVNEDGAPATQAGSHPFQLTTTLVMNQTAQREPVALPKDLSFVLPPGFIGNPTAIETCSEGDFVALVLETNLCPPSSVIGVAEVVAYEPIEGILTKTVPVFNLVPARGEPARFGFDVVGKVPIVIDTSVRSGSDYAVVAGVHNATETAGLLSSEVTLWGVPGDEPHDSSRGWECVEGGDYQKEIHKSCPGISEEPPNPFLTLPTSCAADPNSEPVTSTMEADSWAQPGRFLASEYEWLSAAGQPLGFEGCAELPFSPEIDVAPEASSAATPTGLTVRVKVPQASTLEAGGLAEADIRDTTVTLPQGAQLSPSAANGLEACSEAQIGFTGLNAATQTDEFSEQQPSCPQSSKLGAVRIKTPLLSHPLEGSLYLASPAPNGEAGRNPFGSLVSLYLVAEDPVSGVLVKLAGEGQLSEGNLQVSTTFRNAPQVPFEELELELFGGPKASLSTPARCGSYAANASFTPWSGAETLNLSSPPQEFAVTSGAGGSACASGMLPFEPGFLAQSTSAQAGGFTGFDLELSRPDGDQALRGVTMRLPEGVAALLSAVELCSEAQAAADACPAGSLVGEATAVAGLGTEPYVERGGTVYITGPYGGAPFGLEIVTPAVAGPFNLGTVTVRSKLYINPENASVTIVSDPLPTQLRGIPLQLKRVLVNVNRPDFEFNPTNCDPMNIEGTISGAEGASAGVSSRFQVGACQSLPFAPTLSAATNGHASKADGTDFVVTVRSGGIGPGGVAQAGIAKVDLQLPAQLPARLSTLQKACTERAFNTNPASCPEGSDIGAATIHTPVLKSPLAGPAYLVSHGNAAFPDVEFVLQGEGITLVLDGKTQIKDGVTYSKFESAPDAPFTTFETALPAGPHSALTANVPAKDRFSLCGQNLQMPTTITGQNGSVIEQKTKITVQGCAAVKSARAKRLTNRQKLAKALTSCRKRYRHAEHRRLACERLARRRYPTGKTAHKRKHASKSTGKR